MIFLYENVHTGRPVCNVWLKACLSCTVQHINLPNFSFKNLKFKDFKQRVSLWLQTGKENSKSLLIFRLLKLTFVADDDSLPGPFYLYLQCRSMGRCPGGLGAPPPIILAGTFNLVSGHALHAALRFNQGGCG